MIPRTEVGVAIKREREHREQWVDVKSWWRCIPWTEARLMEYHARVAALRDLREWITTQGDYRDPSLYAEGWNDAMTAVLDLIDGEWAP
jgi:hypothetical protein